MHSAYSLFGALDPKDIEALLQVVTTSLEIQTGDDLKAWARSDLQAIFPHEMLICGAGRLSARRVVIDRVFEAGFPLDYLDAVQGPEGGITSPILVRWLRERRPQLFEPRGALYDPPAEWVTNFKRYALRNIAAHGVLDPEGTSASYFSFSRIPGHLGPRHGLLLEVLVPHLHVALMRIVAALQSEKPANGARPVTLTPREKAILYWLAQGKTNWEIGAIMGCSENTIKTRLRRLFSKLEVNTRAQAVAKTIGLGIPGDPVSAGPRTRPSGPRPSSLTHPGPKR